MVSSGRPLVSGMKKKTKVADMIMSDAKKK
jgi:hypothetical protein